MMAEEKKTENKGKLAVILIRGFCDINKHIKDSLFMLRLRRKLGCVVVSNNPSYQGMINACKDYVTWGEINGETDELLKEKRGRKTKNKEGKEIVVPFYRLHPPRKGFERKGIKVDFKSGGALGYRGDKINDLLKRMI